eukprot:3482403-Pyramimonas_sp.AAC.1
MWDDHWKSDAYCSSQPDATLDVVPGRSRPLARARSTRVAKAVELRALPRSQWPTKSGFQAQIYDAMAGASVPASLSPRFASSSSPSSPVVFSGRRLADHHVC